MRLHTLSIGMALACIGMAASSADPAAKDDAARGAALMAERCAACHGPDGNAVATNFPKLAGQHTEYLLHELGEYKLHHRESELMQPAVSELSDQDMADLAVFLAGQKPAPGIVTDPSLLPLGKKVYFEGNSDTGVPSCDGCHEADGAGAARFPRVAGQNPDYVLEQFRLYATGKRQFGKKVMRTIAERLSEQETRAVAEYMASMP
jgi:cytochrome c553